MEALHTKTEQDPTVIEGNSYGENNLYVRAEGEKINASPDIRDLIKGGVKRSEINRQAIACLLHNGLTINPDSVYSGIYTLGIGDRLTFNPWSADKNPDYYCDFPYQEYRSTQASVPSTRTLLNLITKSVSEKIKTPAALMMSAGKDSTAIALAVKEAGLTDKVVAYTYQNEGDTPEKGEVEIAAENCKALGLKHEAIAVPKDPARIRALMTRFFENAPYPSLDPTTTPYFLGLANAGLEDTGIIDGSCNDVYMGNLPVKQWQSFFQYYKLIGKVALPLNTLRNVLPYHSKINKFLLTYPEICFYGYWKFPPKEMQSFFPHDDNIVQRWTDIFFACKDQPYIDMQTKIRGKHFDGAVILKIYTAIQALQSRVILPFADKAIAEYFFNLPVQYKYDFESLTNKLLLRDMLHEFMGYDSDAVGKRYFYFDGAQFIHENEAFIRDEILGCKLWEKQIEKILPAYLEDLKTKRQAAGLIQRLFMISGWYNHCKYLTRD